MSATLDDLRARHARPPARPAAWLAMLAVAGALAWAATARLDEVVIAPGDVVPHGNVLTIQHLEGGVITRLDVREGARVAAGDPLLQLELAANALDPEDVRIQLDSHRLARARLQAEADGGEPAFPPELEQARADMAATELAAFAARRAELASALSLVDEQIRQREAELAGQRAQRAALETDIGLAGERFAMAKDLLRDGLIARMDYVQQERELETRRGALKVLQQEMARTEAALQEARLRREDGLAGFRARAREDLAKVELAIARAQEQLGRASDQQARTEIRSPVEGVVQNLRFPAVGGVVRGGEAILNIVPSRDTLVVQARLSPTDRGYVREGQDVAVKVTAYDFIRYGALEGKVTQIAATTTVDERGAPYYRVVVETDRTHLGADGSLPITPGMVATVDIHTGDRTVLDFLIRPVLKLRHEALRER